MIDQYLQLARGVTTQSYNCAVSTLPRDEGENPACGTVV
jgi:hypothetical protein